ncbi:hypothetical protein KKI34_15775, partial [Pseudoalteromonas tetraodonis]|nr:hypothetical protein [Pseudoalteromonas tetraodonis]
RFYIGVGTIENYIIGWTVSFGVICTVLLFLSCYKLPFRLVFGKNKVMGKVTIFIFLLVSLTNNALTAKTPALLLLLSTLYIYYSTQEEKL